MESKKSKSQTSASSDDLPVEIIIEILSRLPIKDLFRFQTVCRDWNQLIANRNFSLSACGRNRTISASFPQHRGRSDLKRIRFYSVENESSVQKLPDPIGEIPSNFGDFTFLGTCKGLILFYAQRSIYIWNPSTRCCKELSQLKNLLSRFRSYMYEVGSGFCFDEDSKNYKVIFVEHGKCYVGNLSKKENWAEIKFPYRLKSVGLGSRLENIGVLLNGHLYWIVSTYSDNALIYPIDAPLSIVYFDDKESRFKELPMPKVDDDIRVVYSGLTTLDGCLCMSRSRGYYAPDEENVVLIMREYGIWSTLFTIRGYLVPLETTPSSNSAIVWSYPYMYTYNFRKKYLRKIKAKQFNTQTNGNYNFRSNVRPRIFYEPSVLIIDKGILMYTESLESVEVDSQSHK